MKEIENKDEERQTGAIRYDQYQLSSSERMKYLLSASFVLFTIGYIFYRSVLLALILAAFCVFYPRFKVKTIIQNRKNLLSLQFKEGLYSLSAALSAGRSIESAFEEAIKDLRILYQNDDAFIVKEFDLIVKKIKLNLTVEEAVLDFAERSDDEDIGNFADVFITCKRTGGDIISIIKSTSESIGDKIQIEQEIKTLIAEKRFEQKILNIVPIGLVAFLTYSAGDFMDPVFKTVLGHIVMTIALGLLALSYFISKKIMNIEV